MVILVMSGKRKVYRIISLLLIICLASASLCGCGGEANSKNGYRSIVERIIETRNLSSVSGYSLDWDDEAKAVIYTSLQDKSYWSDILYENFLEGSESGNGNSPVTITVANTKTLKWDTVTSYAEMEENGNIVCKRIKDGIRVTYFFEKYKIAIPVEYTLHKDYVNVAIDGKTILEDGTDYKLVSVSLTPNFCSMKNSAKNGCVFVPVGCGAVMNTAETSEGVRNYSGEVYGSDGARQVPTDFADDVSVRLPVFGVSGNGHALLGIIDEGAGAATVEAQAGNERLGYSNVYAKFYVRGYDRFFFTYHGKPQGTTNRINDNITRARMSVNYYPLYGGDANCSGMAKRYRKYLTDNNLLKSAQISDSPYSVTFLGGTGITKSILGIPKKEIKPLTTFSDAKNIIDDLSDNVGVSPVVRLTGYGDSGIRPGKIAGGSKFLSVYGSKSDLKELLDYKYNFMDYDIVTFAKSGNGFSLSSDTAKTAIKYKAEHFAITPIRIMDENNPYYVISRENLFKSVNTALKKAKKYDNKSVCFSTLGSVAFSDYNDDSYIGKNKIEEDVIKILSSAKKSSELVAVADANGYAVCESDVIFDVSSTSGDYNAFDGEFPFYQMVFHSSKNLYSTGVNTDENTDASVAKAVAYGMGISFTFTENYVEDSDDLDEYQLYGTVYKDNAGIVEKSLCDNGFKKVYEATKSSELVDYKVLKSGVSLSCYENGIKVYTNLTNAEADSPTGRLKPYSFVMD